MSLGRTVFPIALAVLRIISALFTWPFVAFFGIPRGMIANPGSEGWVVGRTVGCITSGGIGWIPQ